MVKKFFKIAVAFAVVLVTALIMDTQDAYAALDVKSFQSDGEWYLGFHTVTKTATTSTKYRTLGFTAYWPNGDIKPAMIYMPAINSVPNYQTGETTTYFRVPITGEGNTVIQRFQDTNDKKKDLIVTAFSNGGVKLKLDSVMTVVEGTNDLGSINDQGKLDGEVYTTLNGIKFAREWAKRSDLDAYFGIPCTIPAVTVEPANLGPTTAIISRDGVEVTDNTSYKVGQAIDLSGTLSKFPDCAEKRFYDWKYRKKETSSYTLLDSGQDKFSPHFPALSEGQYDVMLTVKYGIKGTIYDTFASSKTITLNILQDTKDAYVTAEATASPSKIAFAESDIPVKVTVKGTLSNFTDVSRISCWTLYARKDGTPSELQSANSAAGLTGQAVFNFTIPAEKLNNRDSFTQTFVCRATVFFKDGTSATDEASCHTSVLRVKEMSPPVAVLSCPSTVKAGSNVSISGAASYDKDGEIVEYYWETFGAEGTIIGKFGNVCYMNEGVYNVQLGVEDNDGNGDVVSKQISVMPPSPTAVIKITGRQKEDRVVTMDSSKSSSPERFPLVPSKTRWTITPVGSGATGNIHLVNSYDAAGAPWGVPYQASLLDGAVSKPLIFKNKGEYLVTLTVENTKGLKDTTTATVFINEDMPPVIDYDLYMTPRIYSPDGTANGYQNVLYERNEITGKASVIFTVLRDNYNDSVNRINDHFNSTAISEASIADFLSRNPDIKRAYSYAPLYAKLIITDKSYSPDGGYLQRRKVWVYYDADNNGSFYDPWDYIILLQDLQGRAAIEKNKTIEYLCTETVGKYKVEMEISEGWEE